MRFEGDEGGDCAAITFCWRGADAARWTGVDDDLLRRLAILGVVDMNQTPLAVFFAVNLGFDAVGRDRRAVFAQCGVKIPMKLGPGGVAVYIDRHIVHLQITCRKHSAHDIPEHILLNGLEAVLLAQWIDEGDVGGVGPDFGEQLEIHRVDSLSVLIEQTVNGKIINRRRRGVGGDLATHTGGQEKGDRGDEEAGGHWSGSFYSRRRAAQ